MWVSQTSLYLDIYSPVWRGHEGCQRSDSEPWFPWQLPQWSGLHLDSDSSYWLWYMIVIRQL